MAAHRIPTLFKLARVPLQMTMLRNPATSRSLNMYRQSYAFISTTTKVCGEVSNKDNKTDITVPEEKAKKLWVSTGFSYESEHKDILYRNRSFFTGITLICVVIPFFFMYMPDYRLRDWAFREAHIELARREALGLPLVDPDFVPQDQINLPTEEELGDFKVII